ncbi:DUF992 domain-containing protein [Xanthobacter sp. V4C-4]|uniref:DUF992 domain-containing protein n=1 Tax=Xanthobacter cornucopiae TaxID=3119924 RepID=UPI003727F117
MTRFRPALLATVATLLPMAAADRTAFGQPLAIAPQQGSAPPYGQGATPVQPLPQLNVAPGAAAPDARPQMPKVSAGLLECRGEMATATGFGSTRAVRCEFRPSMGQNHYYVGTLERIGLDIGISDQGSMLWGVLATSPNLERGVLAGTYVGFTSGFALGPGFSANMLAAKDPAKQVTLQPLSVSSDSGLSLSIAGATLTLEPSTPQVAGDPPSAATPRR